MQGKAIKNVLTLITLAAIVSVVFFVFLDFGMAMNPDGSMGNCPFNPDGSICTMNLREHLSTWQTMFAALPQKAMVISFIFLALWFAAAAIIFQKLLLKYSKLLFYDYRIYTKQYKYISLIDPLKRAIYQGIINPKVF